MHDKENDNCVRESCTGTRDFPSPPSLHLPRLAWPSYPAPDPAPEPAMPARFELENLESRAQQTELTDSDVEDVQRTGDVVKLEDFQRAHFSKTL